MNKIIIFLAILLSAMILFAPVKKCSCADHTPQPPSVKIGGTHQLGETVMGPFQTLSEKEMQGVPGSWANKVNPRNPARPIYMADKNPITYYGHGIPLVPVEPGPLLHPLKIAHNSGLAVLPECCPSPYSTDRGCLCGAIEDIMRK